ncbi:uncharacterized protein LOC122631853 [Vespula pensylvanica]|uniref:Uncharacterized protein n=1 Tax=Vespula pensylvanica TaxID=30213 RepID=A0A834NWX9_VESPE|nr:uncharacterized protein LOC122631853 [Vespula pensylvanica]XP_043673946.1 uncharacterized protein LOC122631853 [Vespula pensylvanica]XP_043673948.1 uncharacterized protein LOC122631853 [Vespula pensylvanica]KAF7420045.1 hypothetical protein H0235_010342 [Vespula pensylvanica]
MQQEPWKLKLKERAERTLHVRYTRKIKNIEEVADLFTGDFTVKLPRQPSKNCHVEFSTVEEALQNKRALKGKIVYGKPIVIRRALLNTLSGKKFRRKGKKVKIPDVEPDVKFTQSIFVGNLKCFTKANEIKGVLPGCISVALLKPYTNTLRSAIIKMESVELAAEYLLKKREWPCLHGNRLILKPDTRMKHKNKKRVRIDNAEATDSLKNKISTVETENSVSSY